LGVTNGVVTLDSIILDLTLHHVFYVLLA